MSLLGIKKTFEEIEDACMQPTRLLSLKDSLCVVATCKKIQLLKLQQDSQLCNKLNQDITRTKLRTEILKEISTDHTSIQSLCTLRTGEKDSFSIATVDSAGCTALSVIKFPQTQGTVTSEMISYTSSSPSSSSGHILSDAYQGAGWAGIIALPNASIVATCLYLTKKFTIVDVNTDNRPLRCLNTMKNPTAIVNVDENCVAITEGGLFSMWDSRVSALDGFTTRVPIVDGRSPMWTLCPNREGSEVLVAGSDRNIYVYDVRNLSKKLKCSTPCKFDVVKILPSSLTDVFYICGYDNEMLQFDISLERYNSRPPHDKKERKKREKIAIETEEDSGSHSQRCLGKDKGDNFVSNKRSTHNKNTDSGMKGIERSKLKEQHERGFKAQSNWVGADVFVGDDGNDTIHGLCDLGNIYMLKHAQFMNSVGTRRT